MKFQSTSLNGYKDTESFLEWNEAKKSFQDLTPLRFSYNCSLFMKHSGHNVNQKVIC